jgi:hypothetical protein
VLELHGWGDLQDHLHNLSTQGRWGEMPGLIDDEMLHTFAVVGEPSEVGAELLRRFGDVVTRVGFYTFDTTDLSRWKSIVDTLQAHSPA